jgi:hypothetical protein
MGEDSQVAGGHPPLGKSAEGTGQLGQIRGRCRESGDAQTDDVIVRPLDDEGLLA